MRRKSTRNASKKTSPEKADKESPGESPATTKTRRSRRRRRSPSKTSESEEEVLTVTKRAPLVPEATPDTTMQSCSPSDDEKAEEERQWKVTPAVDHSQQGEIQKLKICLKRPSDSPEKPTKTRRSKSGSYTEDDNTNSSEDKSTRRTRLRGSPSTYNSKTEDEDVEEKKGKGKSKGKHKSKIEKSPQSNDTDIQTTNEISENVQVTPQSPSIDIVASNENECKATDDSCNVNEQKTDTDNKTGDGNEDDNKQNTEIESVTSGEQIKIVPLESDINNTDNQSVDKTDKTELSASDVCEIKKNDETVQETVEGQETGESPTIDSQKSNDRTKSDEGQRPDEGQKSDEDQRSNEGQKFDEARKSDEDQKAEVPSDDCQKSDECQKFVKGTDEAEISKAETQEPVESVEKPAEVIKDFKENETEVVKKEEIEDEKMDVDTTFEITLTISENNMTGSEESVVVPSEENGDKKEEDQGSNHSENDVNIEKRCKTLELPKKRLRRDVCQSQDKTKDNGEFKRKWTTSLSSLISSIVKIDLDSIQKLFPNIEFPQEADLNPEPERDLQKSIDSKKTLERKISVESEKPAYETQNSTGSGKQDSEDNSNIIAFNRKISIVDDTASKLKPPPSPAKNAPSEILFITNLVRPFTIKQLKELLERTGTIKANGFWTDKIKSKCYVHYETVDEAEATRNALHGVQWPIGNGKKLIIDYATPEDLENAMKPPVVPTPVEPQQIVAEKENVLVEKPKVDEKPAKEETKRKPDGPVREWDIGKKDYRGRSPSRERERVRDREREKHKHRRSTSPKDDFIQRKQRKLEESTPQKLMDDLFLKTKSTPSIYWQPLSPEQIQMKQQQRLIRMEEHKRRIEENSRFRGRDSGRGPPPSFRRRYD